MLSIARFIGSLYNIYMSFLKKMFVSHKENNYKPHIFRDISTFSIFFIVIALFIIAVSGKMLVGKDFTALVLPKVLVDYANQDRDAKNYSHLAINPVLEKAAQMKADDMAENSYFAHKSPAGKTPWYWFEQVGYDFSYAGENLAVNFNDSVDVNNAWMNSPGHKANIMNDNFTEIGIATADGMYQGKRTTFVVQLFGRPAVKEKTPVLKKLTPTTSAKSSSKPVAVSSSSAVLSESVSTQVLSENGTNELYVAVEKKSAEATNTSKVKYSNWFDRVLASPEKSLGLAYLVIALVILMSLLSFVFVEFKRHHVRMILLGIGILLVMLGLLYIYKSILISPLVIA